MGPRKRDLEIIYKLQWKNRTFSGDDKASLVGMYDTPATTLKWEFFKKYLLKNSGTTGNDVKVSYFTDDVEIPIESETDFQIALYTFRNKARNGEIIDLVLDRITGVKPKRPLMMNTFHTQTDGKYSNCCSVSSDEPPNWFKKYMKQMKSELTQEVTESVANAVSHLRIPTSSQPTCHHIRKSKSDSKRNRKAAAWLMGEAANEKEILRSLKLEHKLENKLEKLERKTLKIKEKKAAFARSSDSDAGQFPAKRCNVILVPNDEDSGLDAALANQFETSVVPHLMGGEIYSQQWEVVNNGKEAWTEDTEIRYAWGSKPLTPVRKTAPCPPLAPGEKGILCVLLDVPHVPGPYECHWYFYHKGRRFGCSLDCELIVDASPVKPATHESSPVEAQALPQFKFVNVRQLKEDFDVDHHEEDVKNMSGNLEKLTMNDLADDTNCSSDSDNQSIVSIADSNTSMRSGTGSEFVVVSDLEGDEKQAKDEEVKPEEENDDNNNNTDVNVAKECNDKDVPLDLSQNIAENVQSSEDRAQEVAGYAYVVLNGKKVAVPKKFLHEEYLTTAEDAPDPNKPRTSSDPDILTTKPEPSPPKAEPVFAPNLQKIAQSLWETPQLGLESSHSNSKENLDANGRLFVFPQSCPGFEVVHPQVEEPVADFTMSFRADTPELDSAARAAEEAENHRMTTSCYGFAGASAPKYNPYGPLDEERKGDFFTPTGSIIAPNPFVQTETKPSTSVNTQTYTEARPVQSNVHMLPENIVTGAVHVASSAINTARSVLNMIVPHKQEENGKFLNGHWVTTNPESKREIDLRLLEEMGFVNRDYNATLLNRYEDDIEKVILELLK